MTVTPMDLILGRPGDPPQCKVFTKDVSVHWYPPKSKPGSRCFCGATTMREFVDDDPEPVEQP